MKRTYPNTLLFAFFGFLGFLCCIGKHGVLVAGLWLHDKENIHIILDEGGVLLSWKESWVFSHDDTHLLRHEHDD